MRNLAKHFKEFNNYFTRVYWFSNWNTLKRKAKANNILVVKGAPDDTDLHYRQKGITELESELYDY